MAVSAAKAMFEKKAADQATKPPELNRERVARVKDKANAIFAQTDEERKRQDPKSTSTLSSNAFGFRNRDAAPRLAALLTSPAPRARA